MEDKETFLAKIADELKGLDEDLQNLKAKGGEQYNDQIEQLRERKNATEKELERLKDASGSAWNEMKQGFEKSWGEVKSAVRTAVDEFKETENSG